MGREAPEAVMFKLARLIAPWKERPKECEATMRSEAEGGYGNGVEEEVGKVEVR